MWIWEKTLRVRRRKSLLVCRRLTASFRKAKRDCTVVWLSQFTTDYVQNRLHSAGHLQWTLQLVSAPRTDSVRNGRGSQPLRTNLVQNSLGLELPGSKRTQFRTNLVQNAPDVVWRLKYYRLVETVQTWPQREMNSSERATGTTSNVNVWKPNGGNSKIPTLKFSLLQCDPQSGK